MSTLKISFHSFVDVITNSSTVIYVGCGDNTIKLAKELITSLLKVAGLNKTADDFFEFTVVQNQETINDCIGDWIDECFENFEEELKKIDGCKDITKEIWDEMEYKERNKITDILCEKILSNKINKSVSDFIDDYFDEGFDQRQLIIKSKTDDKFILNLNDKIRSIFEIDGERDG